MKREDVFDDLIPDGTYQGEIVEIIYGKDGSPLKSGRGDPQILLQVQSGKYRVGVVLTLCERLAWAAKDVLDGADAQRPENMRELSKPEVADPMLLHKPIWFCAERRCGGHYPHIMVLNRAQVNALGLKESSADDVPFDV
jgi:hypothetical protein